MAPPERVEGSWGIEPAPSRLHVLGGFETGLLWGNLGASLLVIVAGAILVPALSLPAAIVAILIGRAVVVYVLLGGASRIGFRPEWGLAGNAAFAWMDAILAAMATIWVVSVVGITAFEDGAA